MMRILLVCLAILVAACQQEPASMDAERPLIEAVTHERSVPWTGLEPRDDPDTFRFVVVADRTGGHRHGVFRQAVAKINLLAPAFVVSVGDLIEGYTENQQVLDREWDEFEGLVDDLNAPFFFTPGNHDLSNAVMAETWQRRFGSSFYYFTYKNVLFVVLNSELFGMVGRPDVPVPGPWSQQEQMDFVEQVLADHGSVSWTVVLLHQPLWDHEVVDQDWLRVEELLGQRNYTVIAGHNHRYSKQRRNDRNYITLATSGGTSNLRGALFGEFDHVAWVTMTPEGPRIANLMLDGIADDDVSNPRLQAQAQALADSVTIDAPVDRAEVFTETSQTVTITNPSAAELLVEPLLAPAGAFSVKGLKPLVLGPGESRTETLVLTADEPVPYRSLHPAAITWILTAEVAGRQARVQTLTPVLPLTVHPIPRTDQAPDIDGDLSDWDEPAFLVDRQGDVASPGVDPDDVSFAFDVRQDDEALYLAVRVTDDSVVTAPDRIAREQDAVVIAVDARDPAARNRSMGVGEAVMGGDMASMAMLMLTVEPSARDDLLPFLAKTGEATRSAVAPTEDGYQVEVAFPHSLLNEQTESGEWQQSRIMVSVYDFDEGEAGSVVLHWQPYRYGEAPLPGSHTFTRTR